MDGFWGFIVTDGETVLCNESGAIVFGDPDSADWAGFMCSEHFNGKCVPRSMPVTEAEERGLLVATEDDAA